MKHTNVFASKEDFDKLQEVAIKGWSSDVPMITFSVGEGIRRDKATVDAQKLCHEVALKYGLPEIDGYYGITKDGEFVTV